jgi:Fur family ferric uptake transcriptional regulator
VFRNLQDLAEAGVASRVDVGDHTWRFEVRAMGKSPQAGHSHFVCERCSSVSCLGNVRVTLSPLKGRGAGTIGKVSAIVLRGRCRICAA